MKLGSYTLPKEDPKGCFDKHGYNFDVLQFSAKMSTLGLLKIKVFWNKSYDVIISILDVTNKIISCDSNYIVDLILVTLVFLREKSS